MRNFKAVFRTQKGKEKQVEELLFVLGKLVKRQTGCVSVKALKVVNGKYALAIKWENDEFYDVFTQNLTFKVIWEEIQSLLERTWQKPAIEDIMDQSMDEFIGGLSEETKSKLPSDLLEDFKSLPDISETDALTIQNQKLKDDLLRMAAELQNQKNFFERQKEDVRLYASEEFAKNIIVGIDSLEMGLKYTDVESSPVWDILNTQYTNLRQGVDLTIKKFDEVFEKNNLKRIPTHNVVFDPTLHQAISVIASDSHDNDVIVDTLQTGYTYNGRVIRPAMVSVCKK